MYLQAASCISPQASFTPGNIVLNDVTPLRNKLPLVEPDYTSLIDPKLIRRMSRIIRMGVATAMDALRQAALQHPDAILIGTAYGCLDDTGVFLKKLVENKEEMLTPTAFIQSTHNTVGGQIALLLKCNAYNNTYVQRQLSFESALYDALLLVEENAASRILVGAADECTAYSEAILRRFGAFRHRPPAEGAACFVVGKEKTTGSFARIDGMEWQHSHGGDMVADLQQLGRRIVDQPDLVMHAGLSMADLAGSGLQAKAWLDYTSFSGFNPTAAGFGCWLAAMILSGRSIDGISLPADVKKIWLPSQDENGQLTVIRLSAC